MRLSVIKCVCEKSPVVSYHRQQIKPTSDFANGSKSRLLGSGESQYRDISTSKTRTCKRCCIGRHSQNARLERRNASFSEEKIRTATVPGQTLERGKGRNQVAASIKERNCDRQINKIGRDKMMAYLSSFYGTDRKANSLSPLPTPHSPLPLCLLALPEQTAYSRIERRARLGVFHLITAAFLEFDDAVARDVFPGDFLYAGDQSAGRLMSLDQPSGEGDPGLQNVVAVGVNEPLARRNVRARDHQRRAVAVWAGLRLEQDFDAGQPIDEFIERLVLAARRRRWVFVLAVERVGVFACDDDDLFQPGFYELLDDQLNRGFIDDRQKLFRIAQGDRQHSGARTGGGDYACFDFHKLRLISIH